VGDAHWLSEPKLDNDGLWKPSLSPESPYETARCLDRVKVFLKGASIPCDAKTIIVVYRTGYKAMLFGSMSSRTSVERPELTLIHIFLSPSLSAYFICSFFTCPCTASPASLAAREW
jgi:hypothetical protein